MAKKIIQDIVIKKRAPASVPAFLRKPKPKSKPEERLEDLTVKKFKPRRKRPSLKIIFWAALAGLLLFIIFTLVNSFSSVLVKITPKQEFVSVDANFNASRPAVSGNLSFETMQLDYEQTLRAKATGIEKISEKASGQIVIYNAYSSKPQALIERTRFETTDGKIYRTKKRVTVPGTTVDGGEIVPGSLEVTVYADESGEDYNIGLADFTIPGFKGDPRYKKFYARSKTEMTGGFEGTASVITNEDIVNSRAALTEAIKKYLTDTLLKQKPDGFLLYEDALMIDFSEPEDNPEVGDMADEFEYRLKGSTVGFLIKRDELAAEVAKKYLGENVKGVGVANIDEIEFVLIKRDKENSNITFNLKGAAHFVWNVDEDSLLSELKSVKRKEYNSVFARYPVIESAEVVFSPSWWRRIPKTQSRVHFEQILKNQ